MSTKMTDNNTTAGEASQTRKFLGQTLGKADFARRPMSLRKFLEPFDQSALTNHEAGGRYAGYKTDFAKQQLEDFFERNKNHAWFREKYHPDIRTDPNARLKLYQHRLEVFLELYKNGLLTNIALNSSNESEIIRLLDTVAVKLAGGSNEDVRFLDEFKQLEASRKRAAKKTKRPPAPVPSLPRRERLTAKQAASNRISRANDAKQETINNEKSTGRSQSRRQSKPRKATRGSNRTRDARSSRKERTSDVDSGDEEEKEKATTTDSRRSKRGNKKRQHGDTKSSSSDSSDSSSSSSSDSEGSKTRRGHNGGARSRKTDRPKSVQSESSSDDDEEEEAGKESSASSSDSSTSSSGSSSSSDDDANAGKGDSSGASSSSSNNSPSDSETSGSSSNEKETRKKKKKKVKKSKSKRVNPVDETQPECTSQSDKSKRPGSSASSATSNKHAVPECDVPKQTTTDEAVGSTPTITIPVDMAASEGVCEDIEMVKPDAVEVEEEKPEDEPVRRLPLHHTRVLYFPHIPVNVYQKDLNALLSTSPHFTRLAILDPMVMPSTDQPPAVPGTGSSSFFAPDKSDNTPEVSLRRVGWATFTAQTQDPQDASLWINVDVDAIGSKLLQQATEAQAPSELLDCLRQARLLPDNLKRPAQDRVRPTSFFLSKVMRHCPDQLYCKTLLRRHLVMAARVTEELDKARGLWIRATGATEEKDESVAAVVVEPMEESEKVEENRLTEPDTTKTEKTLDDTEDGADGEDVLIEEDAKEREPDDQTTQLPPKEERAVKQISPIDPGDDLLEAATLLGGLVSDNPLLNGLTDYLVDEGSAEEELLLSGGFQALSFGSGPTLASNTMGTPDNTEMLQALDRLIFYLRIVHSVDFYAPSFYESEDAMPHPCQLIHVRPHITDVQRLTTNGNTATQSKKAASTNEGGRDTKNAVAANGASKGLSVSDCNVVFANQLRRLIRLVRPLDKQVDGKLLGLRDLEEVVDSFVKANTLRKKRKTDVIWVCLLSDKKFRDPVYVKKHILNKHFDKIETMKKDTAIFFNNYLLDPMRPQLPLEPHEPVKRRRRRRSNSPSRNRKTRNTNQFSDKQFDQRSHREPMAPMMRQAGPRTYGYGQQQQHNRQHDDYRQFHPPFHPMRRNFAANTDFGNRPFGRMPFFPPRMPFNNQRGQRAQGYNQDYGAMRRGYPRRAYVDLDAV